MYEQTLFDTPAITKNSDNYWTPKWIFDALALTFDLDPACPPGGPIHVPATNYYTAQEDGLCQPWFGRVFMNPPFSKCDPWARRFMQHGNGIAITVMSKSRWCDAMWRKCDAVLLLEQTMAFEQGRIPWPVVMWAIGADNAQALKRVGHVR